MIAIVIKGLATGIFLGFVLELDISWKLLIGIITLVLMTLDWKL